jgi:hypothetical protein
MGTNTGAGIGSRGDCGVGLVAKNSVSLLLSKESRLRSSVIPPSLLRRERGEFTSEEGCSDGDGRALSILEQ